MDYQTRTVCIHGKGERIDIDKTGAISFPIYQTAAYRHPEFGASTGYDYSRVQNPTREEVERIVADLEHGIDAIAYSSGMAAIHALVELFQIGDHIVAGDDLYGGTPRLFEKITRKNGVEFVYVDTSDAKLVESAIKENTKAIFIETPSNPMMKVTDIKEIAQIARRHNCLLLVDNTFLTPYFQKPIDLGADVIIHSGTKYLGGHNDALAGFLVTNRQDIDEQLRSNYKTTGACLDPFESWLILRGIKTLAIRMEEHQKNAMAIAGWLRENPKVREVYYIGLETHPSYEITKKQTTGFGGMVSFRVDYEETAKRILKKVKTISFAESLGGVESLITYPMHQTHADVSEEIRKSKGIDETLLRISVGIEDIRDLICDLKQAFSEE